MSAAVMHKFFTLLHAPPKEGLDKKPPRPVPVENVILRLMSRICVTFRRRVATLEAGAEYVVAYDFILQPLSGRECVQVVIMAGKLSPAVECLF
jgi:hypothetical protein